MTTTQLIGADRARRLVQGYPQQWAIPLVVGGLLCLLDLPVVGFVMFAGVLAWGMVQGGAPDVRARARGRAVSLVALSALLYLSVPQFLAPGGDGLLVLLLATAPLVYLRAASPGDSRTLGLYPPTFFEWQLLGGAALAGVVGGDIVALTGQWAGTRPNIAAAVLTALLLPLFDESVYRGLLMSAIGTTTHSVVLVAVVQAAVVGAGYGWLALVLTGAIAVVFGFVRTLTGSWQAALMAHLGLCLGLLVPYLLVSW